MFSINKNIHNCKVRTQNANRYQSDRVFNSEKLICPVWNGQDDLGRFVNNNTRNLLTGAPGCTSASVKVDIENNLISRKINRFNLNAYGIDGSDLYK